MPKIGSYYISSRDRIQPDTLEAYFVCLIFPCTICYSEYFELKTIISKKMSVPILIQSKNTSKKLLSAAKIFKEETGINYIDYVMNCKIGKAKELLQDTSLSIEEITRMVGYTHAAYFRNKFKEITGKTPNEYRINAHSSPMPH